MPDSATTTNSLKEMMGLDDKSIASRNIITAARGFLAHSPRLCELRDKQKSGAFMDDDETQELLWLETLNANIAILSR